MRTRILAPLSAAILVAVLGLCAGVGAQAPSGTRAFDATTTSTDAAIEASARAAQAAADVDPRVPCYEQNYGSMNVVKGAQIQARDAARCGPAARDDPETDR